MGVWAASTGCGGGEITGAGPMVTPRTGSTSRTGALPAGSAGWPTILRAPLMMRSQSRAEPGSDLSS